MLPPAVATGSRRIDAGGVGSPIEQLRFSMVYGNVHGPGCRVGSSKVAQLAAIARRRCLPHDCHFKCAIMAAGLAKKNAILRNSSRGCLTGRALRRLGFTRSLAPSLSIFFSLAESVQPAGSPSPISLSLARALFVFLFLALAQVCSEPRGCGSPLGLSLRPTGYGSRPHRGPPLPLRLPPGSLSCLPPSSLPRSPPLFLFLQTFLPSSLPPLLPPTTSFAFVL